MSKRVSALEQALNNARMSFSSSTALLDLINQNADNINQIINGSLSVNLTYNTDVAKPGDGIILDKSIPNQIKIINRVQQYQTFCLCKNSSKFLKTNSQNGRNSSSTTYNNVLVLGQYTNYFKQRNTNPDPSTGIEYVQDTFYINIDDSSIGWKNGQTLKIVFEDPIDMSGFNMVIRTDSISRFGGGIFGKTISIIRPSSLISNKPIIEIICTDESAYNFNVDIIR
jgi:hypothetical protein